MHFFIFNLDTYFFLIAHFNNFALQLASVLWTWFSYQKKGAHDFELTYFLLRDGHKTELSEGLKIRRANGNMVGIICPHGRNRINSSAKIGRGENGFTGSIKGLHQFCKSTAVEMYSDEKNKCTISSEYIHFYHLIHIKRLHL